MKSNAILLCPSLHCTTHHETPGIHRGLCKDPPDVSLKMPYFDDAQDAGPQ